MRCLNSKKVVTDYGGCESITKCVLYHRMNHAMGWLLFRWLDAGGLSVAAAIKMELAIILSQ
jgi:hypothetical protein